MPRIHRSLALLALLCPLALHAQSITPKKILFTGAPKYPQAELLAASGLHPNASLTSAEINAGAQALADTGLFTNISFTFDNVALTYKLTPAPASNFLPARYDNFVWWTPEELAAELHHRHPLFTTDVPQSGKLQDALIADLTAMLAEKNVTATVVATPGASALNSMKLDCVHFTIVTPPIRVHAIQIAGLATDLAAKIESVRLANIGQDYSETDTPAQLGSGLTDAIQDEGYLDVSVGDYIHSAPTITPDQINVDLSVSAHPGERYRITTVDWPGSPQLSAADFAKISSLKAGETPSINAWRRTRSALAHVYSQRGYMAAKTGIEPHMDHTAHLVSYTVSVTPGEQYAFRNLTLTGVTDTQRQQFMSTWKLQPGMAYDDTYVLGFLQKNSAALHSLDGYSLAYKQTIDDNIRKVDLLVAIKRDERLR